MMQILFIIKTEIYVFDSKYFCFLLSDMKNCRILAKNVKT